MENDVFFTLRLLALKDGSLFDHCGEFTHELTGWDNDLKIIQDDSVGHKLHYERE